MNSINNIRECELINDISEQIYSMNMIGALPLSSDSHSYLNEYAFNSPVEMREMLEFFWKKSRKEEMISYIQPIVVGAFKNKAKSDNDNRMISTKTYEF